MKVTIVGTGGQGTGLAGLLAMEPEVECLILADYSREALEAVRESLDQFGDARVAGSISYEQVDAGDVADVARVIQGSDVVVNAILPTFNLPIMKACVRESAHYCDLLTLPEGPGTPRAETFAAQHDLDQAFRDAGAIAIPYVGISGAWISLVAKRAIDQMDTVNEVLICFCAHLDTDEFIAPVAPIVQVSMFFSPPGPLVNQGGELVPVDLVSSEEQFDFPGPAGRRSVYTINALGDIALIPQFAGKPIGRLEAKAALGLGALSTKDIWAKALAKVALKQGGASQSINIVDALADTFLGPRDYPRLLREGRILDEHFTMIVEVRGKREGMSCRHRNWSITTLEETRKHLPWSWPAVYSNVGGTPVEYVLAMGRGDIAQRGVLRVTDLNNGEQILDAVASRGHILGEELRWADRGSSWGLTR